MNNEKIEHITKLLIDIHNYIDSGGTERPYSQSIDYNTTHYLQNNMYVDDIDTYNESRINQLETEIFNLKQQIEELKSQILIDNIN